MRGFNQELTNAQAIDGDKVGVHDELAARGLHGVSILSFGKLGRPSEEGVRVSVN